MILFLILIWDVMSCEFNQRLYIMNIESTLKAAASYLFNSVYSCDDEFVLLI